MMTKSEKLRYLAILGAALAVILITAVVLCLQFKTAETAAIGMGLSFDSDSGIYVPDEVKANNETSGIAIPGWDYIEIEAGKTDVAVNLKNPEDNKDKYNMRFTLYLDGEETPLAETGLIKPSESALKLHLSKALTVGEYPAILHIQPYRVSDNTPTNNADIEFVLIVK